MKVAIVASGKTMLELASEIGRSHSEVSRWANDVRRPTDGTKLVLAEALGTTVDALWPPEPEDVAA